MYIHELLTIKYKIVMAERVYSVYLNDYKSQVSTVDVINSHLKLRLYDYTAVFLKHLAAPFKSNFNLLFVTIDGAVVK